MSGWSSNIPFNNSFSSWMFSAFVNDDSTVNGLTLTCNCFRYHRTVQQQVALLRQFPQLSFTCLFLPDAFATEARLHHSNAFLIHSHFFHKKCQNYNAQTLTYIDSSGDVVLAFNNEAPGVGQASGQFALPNYGGLHGNGCTARSQTSGISGCARSKGAFPSSAHPAGTETHVFAGQQDLIDFLHSEFAKDLGEK